MAEALIKYETIDEEQLKDIMAGTTPKPPARLGRHAVQQAAQGRRRRRPCGRTAAHPGRPALSRGAPLPLGPPRPESGASHAGPGTVRCAALLRPST